MQINAIAGEPSGLLDGLKMMYAAESFEEVVLEVDTLGGFETSVVESIRVSDGKLILSSEKQ